MPSIRSGVTISRRAPERAIISAADIAECVPLSSKNSTSPVGVTSPPSTSQLVTSPLGALVELGQLGQPAGRHDDDVGVERQHVGGLGQGVVAHVDAEASELGDAPLDDAQQVLAARVAGGEADLAAGPRHRLQHDDVVAALARDACRLQPARPGADDHDPAPVGGARDVVGHRLLAARRRVVDAQRLAGLVDAVEAVGRPDARADLGLAPGDDLAHDVRVGEMGAGHPDEIDLALADGVAGGRHVVDLGRVQHSQRCRLAHTAGEVEVRRRRHAVDRDHLGQLGLVGDVAADDVDEVDEPRRFQPPQHLQAGRRVDAAGHRLVDGHADADDEASADALTDGGEHAQPEAHAVVERPAVLVGAPVGERRPELVEQVAVGLDLDAVHAAGLHPLGGVGVLADDAVDVPVLGLLGHRPVSRLAQRRRGEHGQPVVLRPPGAPAEVGELDHAGGAVLVDLVGHPPDPRHDGVVVGVQVAERRRAVLGDHRRARRHRHPDAALGLLDVVQPVAIGGHAVDGVRRLVRRREHPVAQRQPLQLERGQQRIVVHDHQSGRCQARSSEDAAPSVTPSKTLEKSFSVPHVGHRGLAAGDEVAQGFVDGGRRSGVARSWRAARRPCRRRAPRRAARRRRATARSWCCRPPSCPRTPSRSGAACARHRRSACPGRPRGTRRWRTARRTGRCRRGSGAAPHRSRRRRGTSRSPSPARPPANRPSGG